MWTLVRWLDAALHKMRLHVPAVCDRYDAHVMGMKWDMFRDWNNPHSPFFVVQDGEGEWHRIPRTWSNSSHYDYTITGDTSW